ncbi:MAG: hypothetical protein FWD58_02635 [Firmicutes bacterium]|nr:hypothetical protein [Bacillota bacterium]
MKKVINIISITITLLLTCVLFACIPANPGGNVHGKDCDCEICKLPVVHDADCGCEECKPVDIHDADCDCEECKPDYVPKGTFYSLQEAFDNGWLTQNEVRSIAYYHNNSFFDDGEAIEFVYVEHVVAEDYDNSFWLSHPNPDGSWSGWSRRTTDYAPIPKEPEVLSEETEKTIKEALVHRFRSITDPNGNPEYPDATVDNFTITRYYGVYNHCYVIMFYYPRMVIATGSLLVPIADAAFILGDIYASIFIWKEN